MIHYINSERFTIERVKEIIAQNMQLALSEDAVKRIEKCRAYLDNKMETQKEPIYGVTTGFGSLCNISVSKQELSQLQKNLVMSHACGVGDEVPQDVVKLMLLMKIQSLSYGHSGVQLQTVQRLIDFFQQWCISRCVPTRLTRSFGRFGSIGPHVPAYFGVGRSLLRRQTLPNRRDKQKIWLATYRASKQRRIGIA